MSVIHNTNQSLQPRLAPEIILLITEDDALEWEDLRRLRHLVVDGFRKGNSSVERFKHAWRWLSDNGYELHMRQPHLRDLNGNTDTDLGQYRAFSQNLTYMIWNATDAGHLRATCDAIHFVVDKDNFGDKVKALIKYNSVDNGEERVLKDIWTSLGKMAGKRIERGSLDFDQDGLWFWYQLNMSVAYLATDRTALKRMVLNRQGFRRLEDATIHVFEHHNEHWYPPEKLCFVRKVRAEEKEPIDPSKYEDRTTGDWYNMPLCDLDFFLVHDFYDCKGYLEHKATEDAWASNEQSVLKDIAKALRRVEARHRENGGLNFDRDGTWCWRELCTSISYICGGCDVTPGDALSEKAPYSGKHEFLRPRGWYPPDDIAHSRTCIIKDIRHKLGPSRFEDNTEADWVNMPLDAWNVLLRGNMTGWELTKGVVAIS
ncbi:hypothetical protein LZL87_004421 [Fusarium oxysporum]|nr:hypothetical protein LZL87_004421 [Fusarium oxysporum]